MRYSQVLLPALLMHRGVEINAWMSILSKDGPAEGLLRTKLIESIERVRGWTPLRIVRSIKMPRKKKDKVQTKRKKCKKIEGRPTWAIR